MGWEIKEELDHAVDLVVEAGETLAEPTTVVDWSEGYPEVVRVGAGDPRAASRSDRAGQRAARWRSDAGVSQAHGVPDEERDGCGGRAR